MIYNSEERKIIAPSVHHLGDIINIIQENNNECTEFFGEMCCRCCRNEVFSVSKFIMRIIDSKIKYTSNSKNACFVKPTWMRGFRIAYQKSIIKCTTRLDYAVCSFSGRSCKNSYRRKHLKPLEINKMINEYGGRMINIGDDDIKNPLVENLCDISLEEKFHLINNAKKCFTIDNGLLHLSALTDTPTVLVYPKWRDPINFSPISDNIQMYEFDNSIY